MSTISVLGTPTILERTEPERVKYTVSYGCFENDNKRYYIILDGDVPARYVNRELIMQQKRRHRPSSSEAYYLCKYLNVLHNDGLSIGDVTYEYIEGYLSNLYMAENTSSIVIHALIHVLIKLYESLALKNIKLDSSVLLYDSKHILINSKKANITTLPRLKRAFPQKAGDRLKRSSAYTKWYTPEQIAAIKDAFPLVDRCIFVCTLCCGYRIDSALSIQLQDFNPRDKTIYAGNTKTHKTHVAPIPDELINLINTYITEDRSRIVESTGTTSPYLFLNLDGKPRTYAAFYASMKRVEAKLKADHPELGITVLHTHAGRSTFLAALRSYQLEQRRLGNPTFSDEDILTFMDWRTMSSLEDYDLLTRAFEVLPFQQQFIRSQFGYMLETMHVSTQNRNKRRK